MARNNTDKENLFIHKITQLNALEKTLGISFKDKKWVSQVLTHTSALRTPHATLFERTEFLGDRVLGLVISTHLYQKHKSSHEGFLSKRLASFVCTQTLAAIAQDIALHKVLVLGESEGGDAQESYDNITVLADTLEALIGAIYMDLGLDVARQVILDLWAPYLSGMRQSPLHDAKSALQEKAQEKSTTLPVYKLLSQTGPCHAPCFEVQVDALNMQATGSGPSKKQAEQEAARLLLSQLKDH